MMLIVWVFTLNSYTWKEKKQQFLIRQMSIETHQKCANSTISEWSFCVCHKLYDIFFKYFAFRCRDYWKRVRIRMWVAKKRFEQVNMHCAWETPFEKSMRFVFCPEKLQELLKLNPVHRKVFPVHRAYVSFALNCWVRFNSVYFINSPNKVEFWSK